MTGRDPYWFHNTLLVMVGMFGRVKMETNLERTKEMVCTPGFTRGQIGKESYKRRAMG